MQLTPPNNFPLIQDYLNILQLAKQWRELEEACNRLLQTKEVADTAWWVYMDRGAARRYLDERDDSLKDYDTALQMASQERNDDAVAMIVQSVENTIGIDAALQRVLRRVDQGETHWGVIAAYLFFKKQDAQSAVAMIEKVLGDSKNLNPNERSTAEQVAGSIYLAAMEYRKARTTYEDILKHDPDDMTANNNMAELLVDLIQPPDPAKAKEFSEKAMTIMTSKGLSDPSVMDTHGWVLVQCGQVDEGMLLLQQSVAKRPLVDTYFHLGQSFLLKNQPADALKCFQKAQAMITDPKNKQFSNVALESKIDTALQQAAHMIPAEPAPNP